MRKTNCLWNKVHKSRSISSWTLDDCALQCMESVMFSQYKFPSIKFSENVPGYQQKIISLLVYALPAQVALKYRLVLFHLGSLLVTKTFTYGSYRVHFRYVRVIYINVVSDFLYTSFIKTSEYKWNIYLEYIFSSENVLSLCIWKLWSGLIMYPMSQSRVGQFLFMACIFFYIFSKSPMRAGIVKFHHFTALY